MGEERSCIKRKRRLLRVKNISWMALCVMQTKLTSPYCTQIAGRDIIQRDQAWANSPRTLLCVLWWRAGEETFKPCLVAAIRWAKLICPFGERECQKPEGGKKREKLCEVTIFSSFTKHYVYVMFGLKSSEGEVEFSVVLDYISSLSRDENS